ncbi:MAG: DUF2127 domain-containing protein [Ktedonobacterales bacterium]
MAATASRSHRSRPFGITILAFLLFVSGLLDLAVVVLSLLAVRVWHFQFLTPRTTQVDQTSKVLVVAILLALSILPLLLARGLWNLKPWAYWGMVFLESINVVFGVVSLMNHQPEQQTLLILAVPVLILLYLLLDHNVHVAFSR